MSRQTTNELSFGFVGKVESHSPEAAFFWAAFAMTIPFNSKMSPVLV